MRRTLVALALAVALGALATGCAQNESPAQAGGDSDNAGAGYGYGGTAGTTTSRAAPQTTAAAAGGGSGSIRVQGIAFPATTNAKAGQRVTWTNESSAPHTVTADDGTFDGELPAGGSFSTTFSKPGSYRYHCNIHPSMRGTVVVS